MSFNNGYLVHHGIKGQKWGIRRFQNEDGSLTNAGRKRRGLKGALGILGAGTVLTGIGTIGASHHDKSLIEKSKAELLRLTATKELTQLLRDSKDAPLGGLRAVNDYQRKLNSTFGKKVGSQINQRANDLSRGYGISLINGDISMARDELSSYLRMPTTSKAVKIGAIATASALAIYGTYKLGEHIYKKHKEKKEQNG